MSENVKVVQDAYACFQRGDLASLLGHMTSDIEWVFPKLENVPYTGTWRGPEQVGRHFFQSLAELTEPIEFEPKEFVAQGDVVIGLGKYKFRVKATGNTYASEFAHVFRFRNGKIASFHEHADTASVERAYRA